MATPSARDAPRRRYRHGPCGPLAAVEREGCRHLCPRGANQLTVDRLPKLLDRSVRRQESASVVQRYDGHESIGGDYQSVNAVADLYRGRRDGPLVQASTRPGAERLSAMVSSS